MRYLPHTEEDIREMLAVAGKSDLEDLFDSIPTSCRYDGRIPLPQPLSEWQLNDQAALLAAAITVDERSRILIGAGSYHHHIPEIIPALTSRSEFLTAYTPYQPEMSQGTLQAIFEYQTLTARLLGMDVANASMYDGASALAEALLMALRISKKKKVALSMAIHPHYREVVKTYLRPTGFELIELLVKDGRTDLAQLNGIEGLGAVAVQSPNFFGIVEDLESIGEQVHGVGSLFVSSFTEPLAFGLLRNPGQCGADIVCGEGQSLGLPRSFGGPGLGMFACKNKHVRSMPGRVVGQTLDRDGKRGFVLTLSTREQHIRREKATSNICSNQGICSLIAGMYMASLGGTGLRQLAKINYDKCEYFKAKLTECGAHVVFGGPTFNEFVASFPADFEPVRKRLARENIVAGLELGRFYPEHAGSYLFCVTETVTRELMDHIVEEVAR
jgi:glycine dehydrogenase subunit 1